MNAKKRELACHRLIDEQVREIAQLRKQLAFTEELRIMQLAAISTASNQNTSTAIMERIGSDNPYWTCAYADTCRAVDREMKWRTELANCCAENQSLRLAYVRPDDLREQLDALRKEYDALIMAVARKFDNETRHQTALRYIREAEANAITGPAEEAKKT